MISWKTSDGEEAHGFYYAPVNPDFTAPEGELPPLIVNVHGGPTSSVRPGLQVPFQYWTSRGFAVLDVNFRGSTSFGRPYRERINGNWGVMDVRIASTAPSTSSIWAASIRANRDPRPFVRRLHRTERACFLRCIYRRHVVLQRLRPGEPHRRDAQVRIPLHPASPRIG